MKVLIAIDDSEYSSSAIDSITNQSWDPSTEFKLVNVVEPLYDQCAFAGEYTQPSVEAQLDEMRYHKEFMEKKVKEMQDAIDRKFAVTGQLLEGPAAGAILDTAEQWNADLIVLGSHGRRGLQKFLLGSVAEKVAAHANCSVEIVKKKRCSEPAVKNGN